jgi:SAM-dependent methyltransferase
VVDAATANRRWGELLARWAIPEPIVAAAAASPYFFDPKVFVAAADQAIGREHDTPSDAAAREALPEAGSVLDVGAGAGAGSLRLASRAGEITGLDASGELLAAFAARARRLGVAYRTIEGHWPEIAPAAPDADVVVCHHVVYNAPDLVAFAGALTAHAGRRVVLELTAVHPMAWMAPYWKAFHDLSQPDRPTAEDAVEVLRAMGLRVHDRRWRRPTQMIGECDENVVASVARRLCLGADRHTELREQLEAIPPPREREVVTLSWDTSGWDTPAGP